MYRRCSVKSATLRGVEAVPVDVEVAVSNGIPAFNIVGMADAAVRESRDRVRAALKASGYSVPADRILVNLAPSALRKTGAGFDLAIAVGLLCVTGQVPADLARRGLYVGELSLDGTVRPVDGLLAYALCARECGLALVCAPAADRLVRIAGLEQLALGNLGRLRKHAFEEQKAPSYATALADGPDFGDVAGNEVAKRALQIAAAGNHGVLMMGPPGSGKTMLASRVPTIMPKLTDAEALEAAVIHSVAGEPVAPVLAGARPFRAPHHSASVAGLVGGGSPVRPGEISLAHKGVLFLDELAEFKPSVLQSIRQPMEEGRVCITRADGTLAFPAEFMLVAASNPCPCGYFGDAEHACTCTVPQINAYQNRIGGPLMDRIDIHLDVRRVPPGDVIGMRTGVDSAALREGVVRARAYASWRRERFGTGRSAKEVVASCRLGEKERAVFEGAAKRNGMSGRGIVSALSVARTIADMDERPEVGLDDLYEALGLRVREGER